MPAACLEHEFRFEKAVRCLIALSRQNAFAMVFDGLTSAHVPNRNDSLDAATSRAQEGGT